MIILDRLMERRESAGRPIRVGMVGAGFMGSVLARQLVTAARGIELVAIANRNGDRAARAYTACGLEPVRVSTPAELEDAIRQRRPAVTENEEVVSRTESIDAVIEVTGAVEFGAGVALDAIAHGKHIVLMNAELDGTLGPVLKHHADRAGVVVSNVDGDQPAVVQNLFRFLRGIGVRPILCGSIKGLEDHYRTPATQGAFAAKWGQDVCKVTSFADGTKISCEQACIANATGMQVARRGMLGPTVPPGTRIEEAAKWFPVEEILDGPGIVDYVVGAAPAPGVFILGTVEDPVQRRYLSYYKMGEGPVYCFQTPYHLCHFEVQNTVARAVEFGDAAIAPLAGPRVEVVSTAKRDLKPGEVLDGIGGYMVYGQCENTDTVTAARLLPIGLSDGCRLLASVAKDQVVRWQDVEVPGGRLSHRLYEEQTGLFRERPARSPVPSPASDVDVEAKH